MTARMVMTITSYKGIQLVSLYPRIMYDGGIGHYGHHVLLFHFPPPKTMPSISLFPSFLYALALSLSILWKEKILLVEELPLPKKAFQILMPLKKRGRGHFYCGLT
jgi:hypothetical protein